jgi:hypothetical protein
MAKFNNLSFGEVVMWAGTPDYSGAPVSRVREGNLPWEILTKHDRGRLFALKSVRGRPRFLVLYVTF